MHECVVCDEAITNPVCPECLETEVVTWLHEYNEGLIPEFYEVSDEILTYGGDTDCILCDRKMCVCTFCYTQHVKNWLRKNPSARKQFRTFFNYGILQSSPEQN